MMQKNPEMRYDTEQALRHPWWVTAGQMYESYISDNIRQNVWDIADTEEEYKAFKLWIRWHRSFAVIIVN